MAHLASLRDLLLRVLVDLAMFPAGVRPDNANEFVAEVVAEMNKMLLAQHITGAAYHPQPQGKVERMHRTLNGIVRSLVKDCPDCWKEMLPFAACILRTNSQPASPQQLHKQFRRQA